MLIRIWLLSVLIVRMTLADQIPDTRPVPVGVRDIFIILHDFGFCHYLKMCRDKILEYVKTYDIGMGDNQARVAFYPNEQDRTGRIYKNWTFSLEQSVGGFSAFEAVFGNPPSDQNTSGILVEDLIKAAIRVMMKGDRPEAPNVFLFQFIPKVEATTPIPEKAIAPMKRLGAMIQIILGYSVNKTIDSSITNWSLPWRDPTFNALATPTTQLIYNTGKEIRDFVDAHTPPNCEVIWIVNCRWSEEKKCNACTKYYTELKVLVDNLKPCPPNQTEEKCVGGGGGTTQDMMMTFVIVGAVVAVLFGGGVLGFFIYRLRKAPSGPLAPEASGRPVPWKTSQKKRTQLSRTVQTDMSTRERTMALRKSKKETGASPLSSTKSGTGTTSMTTSKKKDAKKLPPGSTASMTSSSKKTSKKLPPGSASMANIKKTAKKMPPASVSLMAGKKNASGKMSKSMLKKK